MTCVKKHIASREIPDVCHFLKLFHMEKKEARRAFVGRLFSAHIRCTSHPLHRSWSENSAMEVRCDPAGVKGLGGGRFYWLLHSWRPSKKYSWNNDIWLIYDYSIPFSTDVQKVIINSLLAKPFTSTINSKRHDLPWSTSTATGCPPRLLTPFGESCVDAPRVPDPTARKPL